MKVNGTHWRTIWLDPENDRIVGVIDQTKLPHTFATLNLATLEDMCVAIKEMRVRGAGLIGAAAGFGMYLAALAAPAGDFDEWLAWAGARLKATRPTASNLAWAVDRMIRAVAASASPTDKRAAAKREAQAIADEDAEFCRRIGRHGLSLIQEISRRKGGGVVNVLTHCNAGWLAFVDWGSATAPIYTAHDAGIKLHVWVDETRPRNQGAALTAWELGQQGVPHSLIADNSGGHLMQHGLVDLVITGSDRVTRDGDAANKIGTYLKALAARDNGVPFYVALPSSTFDFALRDGVRNIPIEERDPDELRWVGGKNARGEIESVLICPEATPARNWGFDVTPARLISGLICERGVCAASEAGILELFPEQATTWAAPPGQAGAVAQPGAAPADGVIKYHAEHADGVVPRTAARDELDQVRTELFGLGLIGCHPNGVGYGNVSVRHEGAQFLISGSGTGHLERLHHEHWCLVEEAAPESNRLRSRGPTKASSESLTHGAIYAALPAVKCVIHVHSRRLFDTLLAGSGPRTPASVPYGTPEMARAVAGLVQCQPGLPLIFPLAGHDEGVVACGTDVASTRQILVDTFKAIQSGEQP